MLKGNMKLKHYNEFNKYKRSEWKIKKGYGIYGKSGSLHLWWQ